jgi:uncharacterized protein YecT (DUF1311 family)
MKSHLFLTTVFLCGLSCQLAHSEEAPPPSQLTSRGNIAWQATEDYENAIDSCYSGTPGNAPKGPQFLACLKQLLGKESALLNSVYAGTINYLKSAPHSTALLRQSQRAWLQFRASNCEFAKTAAPRDSSEEFYLDCMLRGAIDRRVELRSLVGD